MVLQCYWQKWFRILIPTVLVIFVLDMVPSQAFSNSFTCAVQNARKSFSDFSVDMVVLFDQDSKYNDSDFTTQLKKWFTWMKSTVGEFRLGSAAFHDDSTHKTCYRPMMKLTSDSSSWNSKLFDSLFQYKSTSEKKTSALAGAVDALLDESMGWHYENNSPNGRSQVRMLLVVTNKEPIMKGGLSGRSAWEPFVENQCASRDGPSDDLLTKVLMEKDAIMLSLIENDSALEKKWSSLAQGKYSSGQAYDFSSSFHFTNRKNLYNELGLVQYFM